jgi:hypothetical protein
MIGGDRDLGHVGLIVLVSQLNWAALYRPSVVT